jgi:hypothetical protein
VLSSPRVLEVRCTIEGAVGYEGGRAVGRLVWLDGLGDDLAQVLPVAVLAAERCHAAWHTSLGLHLEVTHDLGEGWTRRAAVGTRAVHHLSIRRRSPVVAAIDMATGVRERGNSRCKPQALRRRRAMRR